MDVSLFDFHLPKELIAQTPLAVRSESKLMVLNRESGKIQHTYFPHIVEYLQPGDVLVLNDTRVRHARLLGRKEDTGAKIEVLLLKPLPDGRWEALTKPARRVQAGTVIVFGEGELIAIAEEETGIKGGRIFNLCHADNTNVEALIEQLGQAPLPPYIQETLDDPERYQTVFSKALGSAAAPTAGLHFTQELLQEIQKKGVEVTYITLHVGLGTFRPVTVERIDEHEMHAEYYEVSEETARIICKAKEEGRSVIGVGTTSVRTLESVAQKFDGEVKPCKGWTNIFISPGYKFQVVDALLTNFHLPRSTLLMLVSAFSTRENLMVAYEEAVREGYRFFSFGDAMLIVS